MAIVEVPATTNPRTKINTVKPVKCLRLHHFSAESLLSHDRTTTQADSDLIITKEIAKSPVLASRSLSTKVELGRDC